MSSGPEPGLVWLASYPKSGNTWFRAFLTNYLLDGASPAHINDLKAFNAANRQTFDTLTGVKAADLAPQAAERLRPQVYRAQARQLEEPMYIKVHDACLEFEDGDLLFPPEVTAATVYMVRNPLDVAVSFAHHLNMSVDRTIDLMNSAHTLSEGFFFNQLPQRMLSWSEHVCSWLDRREELKVLVLRYEELLEDPIKGFSSAVRHLGLPDGHERVRRAVAHSAFEALKRQEEESGFQERQPTARSFFRQGKAGCGKELLTEAQRQRLIDAHGAAMERLGYLGGSVKAATTL